MWDKFINESHYSMIDIDMNRTDLTDKDIRIGVWTYGEVNTEKNVPPRCHNFVPENIYDVDRVWINVGAWTGLYEKDVKKHRSEWMSVLPTLKNIRFLWVKGSINQEFFEAICKMEWLEALNLQGLIAIRSLENIARLNGLKHLNFGSSSKLQHIEGLSSLTTLITLQIAGFKLIRDITPITKITSLKGLHIHGDMWKKQLLDTIGGIDELINLEYLSLDGTEVSKKDITPITKLKKLKSLDVGYWWTQDDLALLYKSLPNLKYGSVKAAVETGDYNKYLKRIK